MTLITRPADVFEPGDRVYDTETNEIRRVSESRNTGIILNYTDLINHYPGRFLRVIESGERIPKGTVTRTICASGLSQEWYHDKLSMVSDLDDLSVLVSLPETDEELEANGGTPYAPGAVSFSDQSGPSDSKKTGECIHGEKCRVCRQKAHRAEHADDVLDEALSLMQEDWGVMPVDETTQNDVSQPAVCDCSVSLDAILQAAATLFAAEYMGAVLMKEPFSETETPSSRKWCVEQARELAAEIQKQTEAAE